MFALHHQPTPQSGSKMKWKPHCKRCHFGHDRTIPTTPSAMININVGKLHPVAKTKGKHHPLGGNWNGPKIQANSHATDLSSCKHSSGCVSTKMRFIAAWSLQVQLSLHRIFTRKCGVNNHLHIFHIPAYFAVVHVPLTANAVVSHTPQKPSNCCRRQRQWHL